MPNLRQGYKDSPLWKPRKMLPQQRQRYHDSDPGGGRANMTNLKPGHIPNPPTYSRRVDFTFEESPTAVPRFGLTAVHSQT